MIAPSLKKRWFGYKTECGTLASLALLVHYEAKESGGVKAYIYLTEQEFEGKVCDVLAKITEVLDCEFEKKLNSVPPKPNEGGFYTQAWKGENRKIASGKLFYVD